MAGRRGLRPSQVLPLPDQGQRWAPPSGGPPPGRAADRRPPGGPLAWALILVVVLAVLGSAFLPDRPSAPQAELITDVATEDAVVTVLQLFAAEVALADAVPADEGVFVLPGPSARATALAAAVEDALRTLAATREARVGPGTPAETYAAHPDHDALLQVAEGIVSHTADLSALAEVHATLLTGAATVTPDQARQHLQRIATRQEPQLRAWAAALQQLLDGSGDPATVDAARVAAGEEWRVAADRLAPAALRDLTTFLNGIDPGVLNALDGHPVAGPALQRLRA